MNTTYFLNMVMGNVFKTKTSPALPANYYIGLSSTTPTTSGTGVTEPSGGAYARVQMTNMSQPNNGVITNTAAITFPESTGSWGTLTHYVVYDAATGGNLLFYGALANSRTVDISTTIAFKVGEFTITLENG